MAENRYSTSSQDDQTCQYSEDRPPSRLSRVSSTTSSRTTTLTREDVTLMNDNELDVLCRQELVAQCGEDDPELLDHLMRTMDTNKDGKISFEEFRTGLDTVSKHLTIVHSTPENGQNRPAKVEALYEHEPSADEKEEAWLITMDRIDPAGYISNNTELRSVWIDLLTKDSNLLDKFELFLANVVEELDKSHNDVEQIERRMKQVLTNHSREVSEMDGLLDQQLHDAYLEQQVKSQQKSDKLSDQYRDLLAERDELIASLAEQEQTLQHKLTEKVHTEQELRKERLQLLNLNKSLQDRLSDSYRRLSASQREIQRLSFYEREENCNERGFDIEEPLMETSITNSDYPSESGRSLSSQNMIAVSPPPGLPQDPPTNLPLVFTSPSLAIEVAEALQQECQQEEHLSATPTSPSLSPSVTPTAQEDHKLLDSSMSTSLDELGLSTVDSSNTSGGYVLVPTQDSSESHVHSAPLRPSIPIPSNPTQYQTQPSSTPVNMLYEPASFSASTIIRDNRDSPRPLNHMLAPSRVFKVVFLGDSGVGKTSLIRRLGNGEFSNPQSTLGLDYSTCVVSVGEERVVFQLWDTAGQERFQSTTAVYFKRADAFVIVYDVTNKLTFKSIKTWISLVKATLRSDLPVVMVMGNKTDREQERIVTKEEGRSIALELCAMFSETSALSGDNVLQAHKTLASLLLERENQDIELIKRSALRLDTLQQKKRCKC